MITIEEFEVYPDETISANYSMETVFTIQDLVEWVLENQDEARLKFGIASLILSIILAFSLIVAIALIAVLASG